MIPFDALVQKLFNGFAIDADTVLVGELEKSGEPMVFIVKKSHYYITRFSLPILLTILMTSIINIILFFYTPVLGKEIQTLLGIGLGLNVIIWYFSIMRYLIIYNRTYGIANIMKANNRIPILKKGDMYFRSFFNQTIILILFFCLIILVFGIAVIVSIESLGIQDSIVILVNTFLFVWQFHQVLTLLGRFVNLEMDFLVVTKSQIKYFNQNRFGVETTSIDTNRVKSVTSDTSGFVRALFDYGTVSIIGEGSSNEIPDISLMYVKSPEKIEGQIGKIRNAKKMLSELSSF